MRLPSLLGKVCQNKNLVLYVFIPIISVVMHLHVFNRDLVGYHAWRQTLTQTNIENFAHEDFNILNPRLNNQGNGDSVCRLEFPIMQWLFACFYKLFGDYIIISRVLSFIIGLFSVWGIHRLVFTIFSRERIALIAAWCFNFSPVFYYYTVNPLPDNFALCTAIWGVAHFFRWVKEQRNINLIFSAALLSIATLAKLPFIVCLAAVAAYIIYGLINRVIKGKTVADVVLIFTCCFLPPLAWYLSVIGHWQWNGVTKGIFAQYDGNSPSVIDIMQHNLISALPEMLVNYGSLLFFLAGFWFMYKNKVYKKPGFTMFLWWGIAVLLYFFYEMKVIAKVHDYYLFPFLPLLFIIVAYGAEQLWLKVTRFKWLFVIALCILPLTAFLRINHRWNLEDPGFNPDMYQYKSELRAAVPDDALCVCGNDDSGTIFFYYIHKKGWNFDLDTLSDKGIKILIDKGAKYLYSDSRKVEEKVGIKNYLGKLVLQKGNINVFELKAP